MVAPGGDALDRPPRAKRPRREPKPKAATTGEDRACRAFGGRAAWYLVGRPLQPPLISVAPPRTKFLLPTNTMAPKHDSKADEAKTTVSVNVDELRNSKDQVSYHICVISYF